MSIQKLGPMETTVRVCINWLNFHGGGETRVTNLYMFWWGKYSTWKEVWQSCFHFEVRSMKAVSLQAFANMIVNAFNFSKGQRRRPSKTEQSSYMDYESWLSRGGAEAYTNLHWGEDFVVWETNITIELGLVREVQTFKLASNKLSTTKCHATSLVQIALVLEYASLMNGVTKDVRAFKALFHNALFSLSRPNTSPLVSWTGSAELDKHEALPNLLNWYSLLYCICLHDTYQRIILYFLAW